MAENVVPPTECFTFLLGRTFKVNKCDADPAFAEKVVQMQQESMKNHVNDKLGKISEGEGSVANVEEEASTSHTVTDGPCLSVMERKVQPGSNPNPHPAEEPKDRNLQPSDSYNFPKDNDMVMQSENEEPLVKEEIVSEVGEENEVPLSEEQAISPQETMRPERAEGTDHNTSDDMEVDGDVPCSDEEENFQNSPDCPVSVSNKIDLESYSQSEWKGTTHAAEHMRLGYSQVIKTTGCTSMRRIRGDNYCGLRATSFQILSQNLNVLGMWERVEDIISIPDKLTRDFNCTWLSKWSFAKRLKVDARKKYELMRKCLKTFANQIRMAESFKSDESRVKHFLQYFNLEREEEILIFEAIKLLMLHAAVTLHAANQENVPVFSWLLFAREGSETPEQLMKNHLNTVGDTGGLEQVEMCLLGYALNLTIRVIRPSKVRQEDFMTHYPDDHIEEWDKCTLIAEDDRHYNIVVP